MTKAEKYNRFFMDVALRTAQMSYAVRSKVGSVLVKDNRIIATGWNGTPARADNCCEETCGIELKTKPNVIHSEANIIYFCTINMVNFNYLTYIANGVMIHRNYIISDLQIVIWCNSIHNNI